MAFDKNIAMRNAERHLAQGKIKAAISEYRSVVQNDPKDIGTANTLGDLLVKSGEKAEAVINFAGVGQKHLALAWAPLKKL